MWLKANKLSLNIDKTHYIIFQPKRKQVDIDLPLFIEQKPIHRVTHCKFLGVLIDEKLNWKYHVLHLKIKLSKVIGIMYRARKNSIKVIYVLSIKVCLNHICFIVI